MANKNYYGFYSAKADYLFGHVIYLSPEGKEVKVTYVTADPLVGYYQYLWQDKQFVGPVDELVEINGKHNRKTESMWKQNIEGEVVEFVLRTRRKQRERF